MLFHDVMVRYLFLITEMRAQILYPGFHKCSPSCCTVPSSQAADPGFVQEMLLIFFGMISKATCKYILPCRGFDFSDAHCLQISENSVCPFSMPQPWSRVPAFEYSRPALRTTMIYSSMCELENHNQMWCPS